MRCFVPVTGADVAPTGDAMMAYAGPGYLRLNLGTLPPGYSLSTTFAPVRRISSDAAQDAAKVTVIALGPLALNTLGPATQTGRAEVFVVSQLPVPELPSELLNSVARTNRVVIAEEHVERGGLAEHLALKFLQHGLAPKLETRAARGYPGKNYGSQKFHQQQSELDPASLHALIDRLST
jgi:transketolase